MDWVFKKRDVATAKTKPSSVQNDKLSNPDKMRQSEFRYASFVDFPYKVPWPFSSFADSGFFFTGLADVVRCFECQLAIGDWRRDGEIGVCGCDYPLLRHFEESPDCEFVKKCVEQRRSEAKSAVLSGDCGHKDEGLISRLFRRTSHFSYMSDLVRRMKTFENWPGESVVKSSDLAKAGFFYEGSGDVVRCFECDVSLADWEKGNDPLIEHAKYSPECGFVRESLRKGDKKSVIRELSRIRHDDGKPKVCSLKVRSVLAIPHIQAILSSDNLFEGSSLEEFAEHRFDLVEAAASVPPDLSKMDDLLDGVRSVDAKVLEVLDSAKVERQEKVKEARDLVESLSSSAGATEPTDLNRLLLSTGGDVCSICLDTSRNCVFVPCGHLCACVGCGQRVDRCPICRREVDTVVCVFMS